MKRAFENTRLCDTDLRIWPGRGKLNVMMLHGVGSDASAFQALANVLPYRWTLHAWNAPGYGGSAPLTQADPCADDYAERLQQLLEELDCGPVLIIGHSLGTLMGAALTVRAPRMVMGLVLLACAQGGGLPHGTLSPSSAQRIDDLNTLGATAFAATRAPGLFHAPDQHVEQVLGATQAMARLELLGYTQALRMLSSANLTGLAESVARPSLVLVGAQDAVTPPPQSRAVHAVLQSNSPELEHVYGEIEGSGHALPQQRPEDVGDYLTDFVVTLAGNDIVL